MSTYIMIGIDTQPVRQMLSKLEPRKQNAVLRKALRETAKQARERLADKARETYTVESAGFDKSMKIRAFSGKNPRAIIRTEGEPLPLWRFKTSTSGNTTRAQVLKSGTLKELKKGTIKAFVNNIAKKGQTRNRATAKGQRGSVVRHLAVAQREGAKRLGIHEKYSSSIPIMIGSKRAYGVVEPYIGGDLQENLKKFIAQSMGG